MLVDTPVWIDHFHRYDDVLAGHIEAGLAQVHPFVLGELISGTLTHREKTIADLLRMPQLAPATDEQVRGIIESRRLFRLGLSYIDCHLLTACLLRRTRLWTRDKRLARAAGELGVD